MLRPSEIFQQEAERHGSAAVPSELALAAAAHLTQAGVFIIRKHGLWHLPSEALTDEQLVEHAQGYGFVAPTPEVQP
jgi:hypothetical protein